MPVASVSPRCLKASLLCLPSFLPLQGMKETDEEVIEPHFLHLPTEIHEHIIRFCGVGDVASLALVNHFFNNLVRSKLRDFLIAGCQNGKSLLLMLL